MAANGRFRHGIGALLLKLAQNTANHGVGIFALPGLFAELSNNIGFQLVLDEAIRQAGKDRVGAVQTRAGQAQEHPGTARRAVQEPASGNIRYRPMVISGMASLTFQSPHGARRLP